MSAEPGIVGLAQLLEAIASPTRLDLLHALRTPKPLGEIRVRATVTREGERDDRPLARQTVAYHLQQLSALGFVRRLEGPDSEGESYVLDPTALYALVDHLRVLAKLRPILPGPFADETRQAGTVKAPAIPDRPRLVVGFGREDGQAFALTRGEPCSIGRTRGCNVALDWDPFVSSQHARLTPRGAGFDIEDLGSRNGTWLDWQRLVPGRPMPLEAGSVLVTGRSVLVYQGDSTS